MPSALDLLTEWLSDYPSCEVAKTTLPNGTIGFAVRTQELGRWVYAYGSDVDAAMRAALEKARRG